MKAFIEKTGMDKVAHFGVGGLITALLTIVCLLQDMDILLNEPWRIAFYPIIGSVVTAVISVLKELLIDEVRDWKDLYAAMIGSATVFVSALIGMVLYLLH